MGMFSNKRCLRYCKSTIFQANHNKVVLKVRKRKVVCDTAKVRFFKQITTFLHQQVSNLMLFAILQKYDFSSKSQRHAWRISKLLGCLRYCKSTIFQANHNGTKTAQARQELFAILQKYDFSSKSQLLRSFVSLNTCCLRYCKSTIFQANHNLNSKIGKPE